MEEMNLPAFWVIWRCTNGDNGLFFDFLCCETNCFGGCWWRRYWCSCGYFYGSYCLETVWGNSYRGRSGANWNGGDEGEGDGRGVRVK